LPEKKDRIYCKYSKKCVANCNNCII
jgi:hypothetical protein